MRNADVLVSRFGPGVAAWIHEVPAMAARLSARWGLTLGEEFGAGASSIVMRCQWPDGTPAVLKLSPDRPLVVEQAEMLRWFASSGRVPAVLAVDQEAAAVVLEEVLPGTAAEDLPRESLPERWGDLLAVLHSVAVPPAPVRELRDRCEEFFARIGKRLAEPAINARIDGAMWRKAIERCERLLDTQDRVVLLHGDLHPGNVLDGGSRNLMAIDPKVCLGDPCFDAVDHAVAGAGHEGIADRCERVARACGLDGDRLFAWSRVIAPLAAIAHITAHGAEQVIDELLDLAV